MTTARTGGAFDLSKCARPNILSLDPYTCARDEFGEEGNLLLDANENPHGPAIPIGDRSDLAGDGEAIEVDLTSLNRYPDPHQIQVKKLFCDLRNGDAPSSKLRLTPDNIYVGVGSDEVIDAILRCFCVPGRDRLLICPPTYSMYAISAKVNDVAVDEVPLDLDADFALRPDAIIDTLTRNPTIKAVYLCSPGNPTGRLLSKADVARILSHPTWNGVVVVDEAYIDFVPSADATDADDSPSFVSWVPQWPNLIVMQTLSKAFGLAGIRLGLAIAPPPIARLLNALRSPYNIAGPTAAIAQAALARPALMRASRDRILRQRDQFTRDLLRVPGVGRLVGGLDANFLLFNLLDRPTTDPSAEPSNEVAREAYTRLARDSRVLIRFRGNELGCNACLRVSVGSESDIQTFIARLTTVLEHVYADRAQGHGEKRKRLS